MVRVDDGWSGTDDIIVNVIVHEVNDVPTTVADPYPMLEDGTLTLTAAQLLSNDLRGPANESGQNLVLLAVGTAPVNCTVILNAGTITAYPSLDFNGIASFDYTIQDDGTIVGEPDPKTASGIVTITVTPVNDPPSFTKGTDQTVLEDCGLQTVTEWATPMSAGPADESSQTLIFLVSNDNNSLFSAQPAVAANGNLTYTPAANGNGTITVTVSLHDSGGTANGGVDTSAPQTFTITVTPVNDPPVNATFPAIAGIPHVGRTLTTTSGGWNDAIDTDVSGTSVLSYAYQWQRSTDGGVTFADIAGATGSSHALTLLDNLQQVRVKVTCSDTGDGQPIPQSTTVFSPAMSILNDAPVMTEGSAVSTSCDEDGNPLAWSFMLNATDADGDTITWSISTPASHGTAAANGTGSSKSIGYVPDADYNGSDSFVVRVDDGWSGTNDITVNVTVTPVNDPPVNTSLPDISGKPRMGWVLSTTTGTWNDTIDVVPGFLSYTYQWERGPAEGGPFEDIPGATDPDYVAAPADVGLWVRVRVTCTNTGEGEPGIQRVDAPTSSLAISAADRMLTQTVEPSSPDRGEEVMLTITFTNTAGVPTDGLVITEVYALEFNFLSASIPPVAGSRTRWILPPVPPGGHVVLIVRGRVLVTATHEMMLNVVSFMTRQGWAESVETDSPLSLPVGGLVYLIDRNAVLRSTGIVPVATMLLVVLLAAWIELRRRRCPPDN